MIKDIPIPRARKSNFVSKLFDRWIRREKKITRAIAEMFIHGISTRKVKKITKAIWGKEYSAATASRCTKVLQEDYIKWMNRPISKKIRYLFLDGINLKLRPHWISNESLLPKVPVQRCIVHKIRNIVGKCPKNLRCVVPAEAKQIFYATSKDEALNIFYDLKKNMVQHYRKLSNALKEI